MPGGASRAVAGTATGPPALPGLRIRTYSPREYPRVRRLWRRNGIELGLSDRRREIEHARQRDPDLFLVATARGRLIGAVLGRYDGRRGWVHHLAVDARHRRRGVGAALMAELERRLRALGCRKVNLHVLAENGVVVPFYVGLGYRRRAILFLEKFLTPERSIRPTRGAAARARAPVSRRRERAGGASPTRDVSRSPDPGRR
jgi:ribosomal protein S18 acetylase RimI-like enzyme